MSEDTPKYRLANKQYCEVQAAWKAEGHEGNAPIRWQQLYECRSLSPEQLLEAKKVRLRELSTKLRHHQDKVRSIMSEMKDLFGTGVRAEVFGCPRVSHSNQEEN